MKIVLEIKKHGVALHEVRFTITNYLTQISLCDLLTPKEIEALELNLTNMIQQLYDYRKKHGLS